jgi:EmrB/QacA subfamily drug resistance transporter
MDRRRFPPDEEVAPRAWAGLAVVAAALFVATLDAMVLYVAFGTIRRDFPDVSAAALSWILSGYTIVLAAGMIGAGRWADRLGRRRVFLAGMGVFTVASALCAVAPGVGVLVAARALQGFGAAALTPASLALILRAFPKSRVPQAIALWGAAGALAAALGPTIGGLFVEAWGWRSVFVVNVPIGIAVAIFGRRLLDESREPDGSRLPDPVGTVVVTVALVLLALAIVQSGAWGWSSTRTVGALLGAVVLLGAFAGRCATVPNPVLALDLFSERGFRWANLGQLLYGTGFTIMFFGNVQFLREVWGYSPVWTGLAMAPRPLVVFLLAPPFGRLAGRIGQRPILIPGGGISAAAALFLLSRVDSAPAYLAVWLPFTLVSGVGVSMVLPLLTSAAVAGLPSDRFATGSAVNAALRNLGQTLGVAIFVAVAGRTTADELLAHHRIAWWLVAAAGVAVSATSWRLPRVGSATRAGERDRHLILLRPTASRPSPIVAGEPATTRRRRVLQGVSS